MNGDDYVHAALLLMGFTYHGSEVWHVRLWRLEMGGGRPPITVKYSGNGHWHARQWASGRSSFFVDGGGDEFLEKLTKIIGAMYVSGTQPEV